MQEVRDPAQDPEGTIEMFHDHMPELSWQEMEKDRMITITHGVSALINIRAELQRCKDSEPPDVEYYKLERQKLLELLCETMTVWNAFEDAEELIRSMISKMD